MDGISHLISHPPMCAYASNLCVTGARRHFLSNKHTSASSDIVPLPCSNLMVGGWDRTMAWHSSQLGLSAVSAPRHSTAILHYLLPARHDPSFSPCEPGWLFCVRAFGLNKLSINQASAAGNGGGALGGNALQIHYRTSRARHFQSAACRALFCAADRQQADTCAAYLTLCIFHAHISHHA